MVHHKRKKLDNNDYKCVSVLLRDLENLKLPYDLAIERDFYMDNKIVGEEVGINKNFYNELER